MRNLMGIRLLTAALMAAIPCMASANLLLEEPFDYPAGILNTVSSGVWHLPTGAPPPAISVIDSEVGGSTSLVHASLAASSGNRVRLEGIGFETNLRSFAPVSGAGQSVYCSFLVRAIVEPPGTGAYIFHFSPETGVFLRGRIYARSFAAGLVSFGVRAGINDTAIQYAPANFAVGETVHLVVRYTFGAPGQGDTVRLYLNPNPGDGEPATASATTTGEAVDSSTAMGLGRVAIRQEFSGSGSTGTMEFDELRVAASWNDLFGIEPPPPASVEDWAVLED